MKPEEVATVREAARRGLGKMRLEKVSSLRDGRVQLYRGVD